MRTVIQLRLHRERRDLDGQSKPVAIWPIKDLAPATPSAWLMETIAGQSYEAVARSVWTHHPNLRIATEKLGEVITHKWPNAKDDAMLAKVVRHAVPRVDMAMQKGEGYSGRVIGLYLFCLTRCIPDVARLSIYGKTGDGEIVRWKAFSEPLQSWALKNGMQELEAHLVGTEPSEEESAGLRTHLVARITTDPVDAGYLEMHASRG